MYACKDFKFGIILQQHKYSPKGRNAPSHTLTFYPHAQNLESPINIILSDRLAGAMYGATPQDQTR